MTRIPVNMGDAFLVNTPPNGQHLYIAIAEISENSYLFVNVTTKRANSDISCILVPGIGVPAFINRESTVAYKFAREIDTLTLARLITPGSTIPKDCCSPDILSRIQQGGLISRQLKRKYKNALRNFLEN